ncbi:hypothetical protein [Yersinia phage vB_YenM_P778]
MSTLMKLNQRAVFFRDLKFGAIFVKDDKIYTKVSDDDGYNCHRVHFTIANTSKGAFGGWTRLGNVNVDMGPTCGCYPLQYEGCI